MAKSAKSTNFFSAFYCYQLSCLVVLALLMEVCVSQADELPGVVTADEAAKFLRVSKATLLRLANKSLLPGVKIGRQWRFSKKTILDLLNNPEWLQKMGVSA